MSDNVLDPCQKKTWQHPGIKFGRCRWRSTLVVDRYPKDMEQAIPVVGVTSIYGGGSWSHDRLASLTHV
eukprot:12417764-Karenia_brevis.AAC.1